MSLKPQSPKKQPQKPQDTSQEQAPSLQERIAQAQARYEKFSQAATLPGLSPKAAELARQMARSAQASMKLGQKALDYAEPNSDPEVERNANLYRLFRLPLPNSSPENPASSTKPETFGSKTSPT